MGIWEVLGVAAMIGILALIILKRKSLKKNDGLFAGEDNGGDE